MGLNGQEAWKHGTAYGAWEGNIPQKFSDFRCIVRRMEAFEVWSVYYARLHRL